MFRSAYDGKQKDVSEATSVDMSDQNVANNQSRTKQADKDSCNINKIMERYRKTGVITHFAKHQGRYDDFTDLPNYHEAMGIVAKGNEAFASLPASIRKRFNNDAGEFLTFVTDAGNIDEMVRLGLAQKVVEESPAPAGDNAAPQVPTK